MDNQIKFKQILFLPYDKGWKFLLANLVLSLLIITFFFGGAYESTKVFLISLVWGYVICTTQWSGNVVVGYYIGSKYPIIKKTKQNVIWSLIGMVVYSVVAYILIQTLMYWLVYGYLNENVIGWILKSSYVPVIVSASISLIFSAIGFFGAWQKTVLQAEKLKSEMLSYKYESLRNQINPHFLFNSFNVLSDLIYDDQKQAVQFVHQMSDLFRYVLDSRDKELVPLDEEMDFIESYIYLLKTRFDDKVEINNNISIEKDDLIVPMSLQMLIENAIKHNEASTAHPLKIDLSRNEQTIEVKNNLKLKITGDHSNKTGLKNIRQQYVFFTSTPIEVLESDQLFSVKLPILKSEKE